jgi:phage repressor protein C with HTH and peptisase S24 domain
MFPYERMKQKMIEKGVTNADIARATGKSTAAVSKWTTGQNMPKGESLFALSALLGVHSQWILTGADVEPMATPLAKGGATLAMLDPRPVVPWDSDTPLDKDEIAVPFFKDFPVSCGTGAIGEAVLQNEHRRLRLSKSTIRAYGVDPDLVIVVTAHGNSNDPDIKNKASVHIELIRQEASDITDGCYYGICHGGAHFFKKLHRLPGGGLRVVSGNRDKEEYPDYSLTKEQIIEENFTIEGYAFDVQNPLPRR